MHSSKSYDPLPARVRDLRAVKLLGSGFLAYDGKARQREPQEVADWIMQGNNPFNVLGLGLRTPGTNSAGSLSWY